LHHKEDTTTSIKDQSNTTTTTIKTKGTIRVVCTKTTIIMLHTGVKIKEDITNTITPKAKTWVINKRKVITTLTVNHSTNQETHSTNGKHHKAIQ